MELCPELFGHVETIHPLHALLLHRHPRVIILFYIPFGSGVKHLDPDHSPNQALLLLLRDCTLTHTNIPARVWVILQTVKATAAKVTIHLKKLGSNAVTRLRGT